MTQQSGQILRKNEVRIAGSCRIGSEASGAAVPKAQAASAVNAKAQAVTTPAAQAKIVENTPKGVIIEVLCPCGCKSYIECEYGK